MIKFARKYHKWLMTIVGIQFLCWTITGVYMVSMDIHFIHGELMQEPTAQVIKINAVTYPINEVFRHYPNSENLSLVTLMGRPVYQFRVSTPESRWLLLDAATGKVLPLIDRPSAIRIAREKYTEDDKVSSIQLIRNKEAMPAELSPRHLPVWRVQFDHFSAPTFYINEQTGQVVTRRHHYWRLFDWMWRFHIMDYDNGENVSNKLLLIVALISLLAALAGAVLTYFRTVKPSYVGYIRRKNG